MAHRSNHSQSKPVTSVPEPEQLPGVVPSLRGQRSLGVWALSPEAVLWPSAATPLLYAI